MGLHAAEWRQLSSVWRWRLWMSKTGPFWEKMGSNNRMRGEPRPDMICHWDNGLWKKLTRVFTLVLGGEGRGSDQTELEVVKQTLTQGECLTFRPHLASQSREEKKKKIAYFSKSNHAELIGMPLEHCTQTPARYLADIWRSGFKGHGPLPLSEIDAQGYTLQRKPQKGVWSTTGA